MPERPDYKPGGVTGKGFMPGQSGNPGGRPKGRGVTAQLRRLLEELHNGKAIEELVAQRWLKDALSGKPVALAMLLERTEGKVPTPHEVKSDSDHVVRIQVSDLRGNTREFTKLGDFYNATVRTPPGVVLEDPEGNRRPGTAQDIRRLMAPNGEAP